MSEQDEVREVVEILKSHASELAGEKKHPEWWCVAGYADVLADALKRIDAHERRAVKVYGDRAVTFAQALTDAAAKARTR